MSTLTTARLSSMLRGVKIIDVSAVLPGALICSELQKMGAEVVRVEGPDQYKKASILGADVDRVIRNRKTLVPMDLKLNSESGAWKRLVKSSDALVHGFLPETAKRLGLAPSQLHRINPRLTVLTIGTHRPLHDLNVQGQLGLLSVSGEMPALPVALWALVMRGSLELLHALQLPVKRRPRSIKVSIVDCLEEWIRIRSPLLAGEYPCYQVLMTQKGNQWTVAAAELRHWRMLNRVLGTTFSDGDRFATGLAGQRVRRAMQKAFDRFPHNSLKRLFAQNPCCVEPSAPLHR